MGKVVAKVLSDMRTNPKGLRFSDLCRVCDHYFGKYRTKGSHRIYKQSLPGKPPLQIQEGENGKAKPYQVRQVLEAIGELGLTE
jgi:hypothetical protein